MDKPLVDPRIEFPLWLWKHGRPETIKCYQNLDEIALQHEYIHSGTPADFFSEAPMACDDLGRLIVISIDAQVVNGAILVRTESDAEVLEMLEASRNGTLEEFARGRKTKFFGFSNI